MAYSIIMKLSEAEEMWSCSRRNLYRLSKSPIIGTVSNAAVNISEAAFKAIEGADPQYREKVNSFYKRTRKKKTGRRNCWKNIWKSGRRLRDSSRSYWMKRLQRRSRREARLAKAWAGDRQMAAASNAYDANVMTETAAGGDTPLGNEGHHARTYRKGAWAAPNDRGRR